MYRCPINFWFNSTVWRLFPNSSTGSDNIYHFFFHSSSSVYLETIFFCKYYVITTLLTLLSHQKGSCFIFFYLSQLFLSSLLQKSTSQSDLISKGSDQNCSNRVGYYCYNWVGSTIRILNFFRFHLCQADTWVGHFWTVFELTRETPMAPPPSGIHPGGRGSRWRRVGLVGTVIKKERKNSGFLRFWMVTRWIFVTVWICCFWNIFCFRRFLKGLESGIELVSGEAHWPKLRVVNWLVVNLQVTWSWGLRPRSPCF